MLQELRVSHFAIIDSLQIEFQEGLNILSGETGSGKSVLLKSLALLMGEKASSDIIRTGSQQATVEGSFNLEDRPDLIQHLEALGIDTSENMLIVRRIISAGDKSKVYLNGVLSTLNQLREVVSPLIEVTGHHAPLIEMTGQHDNRNLLSKSYHLDLIDQFSKIGEKRNAFEELFTSYQNTIKKIHTLENESHLKAQRLDYLKFQAQEFIDLELDPEIDAQIENDIKILKNSSKILHFKEFLETALYDEADGIHKKLSTIIKKSQELAQIDANLQSKTSALHQAQQLIDDVYFDLTQELKKFNLDPEELEIKEARLSQIRKLQKKHGILNINLSSQEHLHELIKIQNQIESEIKTLENSDELIHQLKKEAQKIQLELLKMANDMHSARLAAAQKLTKKVNAELLDLNMKGVTFDIYIDRAKEMTSSGQTDLEFLSQTSPKDPKKSLSKAASGGELSRILLALKKSLGHSEQPRTYLFDEVDTGVSGPTAEKVGKKLKDIAFGQQVICVTHLPQVAAYGDVHFTIQKTTLKDQAVMSVTELDKKARIEEIARLISGEKITKTSLAHAQQLLKECQN